MTQTGAVQDYSSFVDDFVEESGIDQNEATKGGGGAAPPAEGRAYARLVEYIELGAHLGTYQGKPKAKPDHLVRIVLELSGKKYPPIEHEDGTSTPQKMFLELSISTNEKSRFYKMFRAINGIYADKYKHFASMAVDQVAFIVNIKHRDNGKTGDDKRVYANIWADGAWQIQSLIKYDEDGEAAGVYTVSAAVTPTTIFLFNRPRTIDWQKLYIDGVRDDGASKNWIQERILSAVNFGGSALEVLLADLPIPTGEKTSPAPSKAAKKAKSTADMVDDI